METPNFKIPLMQSGDMIFGKIFNDAMMALDKQVRDALYGDHTVFYGSAAAVAAPGAGLTAPVVLVPVPEAIFTDDVALKKMRVIIPALTNTIAGAGVELNVAKASAPAVPLLAASIAVPAGAALDTVVSFPAGTNLDDDDEMVLYVENITAGPIAGAFDVQAAVSADIIFPGE